jgi:hypothetical protein
MFREALPAFTWLNNAGTAKLTLHVLLCRLLCWALQSAVRLQRTVSEWWRGMFCAITLISHIHCLVFFLDILVCYFFNALKQAQ